MAITVTVVDRMKMQPKRAVIADVAFDDSYPTGGEAITAANFGLVSLSHIIFIDPSIGADKRVVHDRANGKLMIYAEAADGVQAEAANESNQAAVSVRVMAIGV
jgi:hypothetical protein